MKIRSTRKLLRWSFQTNAHSKNTVRRKSSKIYTGLVIVTLIPMKQSAKAVLIIAIKVKVSDIWESQAFMMDRMWDGLEHGRNLKSKSWRWKMKDSKDFYHGKPEKSKKFSKISFEHRKSKETYFHYRNYQTFALAHRTAASFKNPTC